MRRLFRARRAPEPVPPAEEGADQLAVPPELLKRIRAIEIRARRLVNNVFLGEYHAVFRGRGIEFSEVREYQPGDDVRSIDWNVTARMGQAFVKKFVEERELTVMLVMDVSASEAFGSAARTKREVAAEVGALLAFTAMRNNDKVGLVAFSDRVERYVPPRKGRRHVLRVMRELLYFQPEGRGTNIAKVVDFLRQVLHRHSVVFILSDFQDRGYESSLRVLSRRHDVTAITVSDPRELQLPAVGLVEVEDAETGAHVLVDTSSARVRKAYAERALARREEVRRLLLSTGVDRIELDTSDSYVEPLIAYFRRRERPHRRARTAQGPRSVRMG